MTTKPETAAASAAMPVTAVGVLLPGPNGLERVAGVPIALRAGIVLKRAGCAELVLASGSPTLTDLVGNDPRAGKLAPLRDGDSGELVVLVQGDVVFPVTTVEKLRSTANGGGSAFAASSAGLVFVGGRAVATEIRAVLEQSGLEAAIARAASAATRIDSPELLPAATPAERRAATAAVLRATGKAVDGPLTRLFERRISQTISRALLPFPVSPNAMTTVSFAIGLSGAALLATTSSAFRAVGAALFVFATIVDGCDGEIARSKFMESPFGKLYDTAVDIVVNAAVFVGIGVGTWRELGGVSDVQTATLLLVGGGVLAMAVVESVRRLAPRVEGASVLARAQGWLEWFATVEWCYLVLGLALIDQLPFFFFGAAVGANVFAVVYLLLGVLAWRRA